MVVNLQGIAKMHSSIDSVVNFRGFYFAKISWNAFLWDRRSGTSARPVGLETRTMDMVDEATKYKVSDDQATTAKKCCPQIFQLLVSMLILVQLGKNISQYMLTKQSR